MNDEKLNKNEILNCTVDINTLFFEYDNNTTECYDYYRQYWYPQIYYIEPKVDKGELAYKIVKTLRDEKLIEIRTVKNFIEVMDKLIKIL